MRVTGLMIEVTMHEIKTICTLRVGKCMPIGCSPNLPLTLQPTRITTSGHVPWHTISGGSAIEDVPIAPALACNPLCNISAVLRLLGPQVIDAFRLLCATLVLDYSIIAIQNQKYECHRVCAQCAIRGSADDSRPFLQAQWVQRILHNQCIKVHTIPHCNVVVADNE